MSAPRFPEISESKEVNIVYQRFARFVRKTTFSYEGRVRYSMHLANEAISDKDLPELVFFLNQHLHITHLHLGYNQIGDEGIAYFALNNQYIIHVDFDDNYITDVGAIAFAKTNKVVREVGFSNNEISDLGANALLMNKVIQAIDLTRNPNIKEINVQALRSASFEKNIYFFPGAARGVAQDSQGGQAPVFREKSQDQNLVTRRFSRFVYGNTLILAYKPIQVSDFPDIICFLNDHPFVTSLDLSSNPLGDQAAQFFAENNSSIKKLNLELTGISTASIVYFLKRNHTITHLDISFNHLDDEAVFAFVNNNQSITHLNFSTNNISCKGITEFARKNTIVTEVDFSRNQIKTKGCLEFAIANQCVNNLNLGGNNIGNQGLILFAKNNRLVSQLTVDHCNIDHEGIAVFGDYNNKVTHLNVGCNDLKGPGFSHFAKLNKTVTHLVAYTNDIGKVLIDFAKENKIIQNLDVSSNEVDDEIIEAFAKCNQKITSINLNWNRFTNKGVEAFASNNKTITDVSLLSDHYNDVGASCFLKSALFTQIHLGSKVNSEMQKKIAAHMENLLKIRGESYVIAAEQAVKTNNLYRGVISPFFHVLQFLGVEEKQARNQIKSLESFIPPKKQSIENKKRLPTGILAFFKKNKKLKADILLQNKEMPSVNKKAII